MIYVISAIILACAFIAVVHGVRESLALASREGERRQRHGEYEHVRLSRYNGIQDAYRRK